MVKFGKRIHSVLDSASVYNSLAYDVLKKAIDVVVADGAQAADQKTVSAVNAALGQAPGELTTSLKPPDSRFHGLLTHELAKVNRYASLQLQTLLDTLREAQRLAAQTPPLEEATITKLEQLLDNAAEQMIAFEQFKRLNFTGFRKIVKKFDKKCSEMGTSKGSLGSWFLPMLLREPFAAESLDPQLLALAAGYAALRRHRRYGPVRFVSAGSAAGAPQHPIPADVTSTFWVSPPERLRALCALIKRFEIVTPPTEFVADATPVEKMRRALQSLGPSGRHSRTPCHLRADVSMVYYDGADFPEYMGRLQSDGPRGFRTRQTVASGQLMGAGGLVERDGAPSALGVHAFTPVQELSVPEAFPFLSLDGSASDQEEPGSDAAERLVASAATAALGSATRQRLVAFAAEVQDTVSRWAPMRPVATVRASRVLLRGDTPNTEGISIAFDEDVQFGRGAVGPSAAAWGDAADFPYSLLEVASERGVGPWLEELRSTASLQTIQGFSVGAHAVAALYKESLPKLPNWYKHLNNAENWGPLELWGMMHEWRAAVAEEEAQEGEAVTAMATIAAAATARQAREVAGARVGVAPVGAVVEEPPLEPKNFMASERTMLEWIHTVLALAAVGIGLWKYSLSLSGLQDCPEPVALGLLNAATTSSFVLGCYSLSLVAIAVCFAWYAVAVHTIRLQAMQENKLKESTFNRRGGPGTFAFAVGLALLSHLLVQAAPLWMALGFGEEQHAVPPGTR